MEWIALMSKNVNIASWKIVSDTGIWNIDYYYKCIKNNVDSNGVVPMISFLIITFDLRIFTVNLFLLNPSTYVSLCTYQEYVPVHRQKVFQKYV